MRILAIGGSVHDFSACVVTDGKVTVAIEEERLSRIKSHPLFALRGRNFALRSVDYCLDVVRTRLEDFDLLVANDLVYAPMMSGLGEIVMINHHLAHASCAFYSSPHPDAAVLVVDGFGSIDGGRAEIVSYFDGSGSRLECIRKLTGAVCLKGHQRAFTWRHFDYVEDSLGGLYSFITDAIGFGFMEEGKTMGLSPYGRDRFCEELAMLCDLREDGTIRFRAREREQIRAWVDRELDQAPTPDEHFLRRADFALAVQRLLEEAMLAHANQLAELTDARVLCLGGGVALNCLANYRLATGTRFDDVWVHGAAGDSGTALGAALWAQATYAGRLPAGGPGAIYAGREYTPAEIDMAIDRHPELKARVVDDPADVASRLIADGAVVGWFQGGSEFGPRALGNRSILADPSRASMKDVLNLKVKRRESFRPFAPSILAEAQAEYFGFTIDSSHMTFAPPIAAAHATDIPAATHVDGSSRIQTVAVDTNARYHDLISGVGMRTGTPAVLNTSFNEQEPIVETPNDALACFERTSIDFLFLGDRLVTRTGRDQPPRSMTC